jgi:hypothetical protein
MPIDVPAYIKANAQRGLDYNREGKGGDGLTDLTLAEARDLAKGFTTEAKVRKMGPWFSRHRPDMSAPANDPDNKDFPGAGAVAWLLWGGSTSGDIMDAAKWAEDEVRKLDEEAKAFDSKCINKMSQDAPTTVEEKLAHTAKLVESLSAEKTELQNSFEKLAAEKLAGLNEATEKLAKSEQKLAELETVIKALEAEKSGLKDQLAEALANQVTASKEAAKIVASLGTSPVAINPADDAKAEAAHKQTVDEIRATFLKMPAGPDRQAFFIQHQAILTAVR